MTTSFTPIELGIIIWLMFLGFGFMFIYFSFAEITKGKEKEIEKK